MIEYKLLEPNSLGSLGISPPTFSANSTSFSSISIFLWTFCFMVIIVAAFWEYVLVGVYRIQASEAGIRKSNETFKRATLGLFGVFSLFLLVFTVNKGLLTGDVGLVAFSVGGSGAVGGVVVAQPGATPIITTTGGSGSSLNGCQSPAVVKSNITSGNVCAGTICTTLSGCQMAYADAVKIEARRQGVDPKMMIVTMCKESKGNPNAKNQNKDGTYDCGLMQVNQKGPCEANTSPSSIQQNIAKGVTTMKNSIDAVNSAPLYPGFTRETSSFATYNCCSNGTKPYTASVDCNSTNGFGTIPKWACPVDGNSGSGMCVVKNYACELTVCLTQLQI